MTTRVLSISSLIVLVVLLMLNACGKDENPTSKIEYPILYKFEGATDWDFDFYEYNEPGYAQINVSEGSFTEAMREDQLDPNGNYWVEREVEQREVELLSDREARVLIAYEMRGEIITIDTTLQYDLIGDSLHVYFAPDEHYFSLVLNPNYSDLSLCIQSYAYASYDTFLEHRRHVGVGTTDCRISDPMDFLDSTVVRSAPHRTLRQGDTIAIHNADMVWDRE